MLAPERFAAWLDAHSHIDARFGHTLKYHSRSDAHSIALCTMILEDLVAASPVLGDQLAQGTVIAGTNLAHTWMSTGKRKGLDLAVGPPSGRPTGKERLADVYLACEAKANMTEHGKSQPRVSTMS